MDLLIHDVQVESERSEEAHEELFECLYLFCALISISRYI